MGAVGEKVEDYTGKITAATMAVDRVFPAGYLTSTPPCFHKDVLPAHRLYEALKSQKEDYENESNRIPIEPCPNRRGTRL